MGRGRGDTGMSAQPIFAPRSGPWDRRSGVQWTPWEGGPGVGLSPAVADGFARDSCSASSRSAGVDVQGVAPLLLTTARRCRQEIVGAVPGECAADPGPIVTLA